MIFFLIYSCFGGHFSEDFHYMITSSYIVKSQRIISMNIHVTECSSATYHKESQTCETGAGDKESVLLKWLQPERMADVCPQKAS